jgi:hypothetical protein
MFTTFQSLCLFIIILIHEPRLTTALPLKQVTEEEFIKLVGAKSPTVQAKLRHGGHGMYMTTSSHKHNDEKQDMKVTYLFDGHSENPNKAKTSNEEVSVVDAETIQVTPPSLSQNKIDGSNPNQESESHHFIMPGDKDILDEIKRLLANISDGEKN